MKESFEDFVRRVPKFSGLSPADKICHTAWYLHSQGQQYVNASSINSLFNEIHAVAPHTSVYLSRLADRKPPIFLRSKSGYRLESAPRRNLDEKLRPASEIAVISALLSGLLAKLGEGEEAKFLDEALRCYSVRAFRASIVMAWNLAFDHLLRWVMAEPERITSLNDSLKKKYEKKNIVIGELDDFAELKEFEVIETLQHAKLVTKNLADLLKEKLKRRNAAAHPSSVIITQAQADDVITDLVNNVVLKLN
jgi:hypothetical protein